MTKSDEYLDGSVAPLLKSIFADSRLGQGSVIVEASGLEEELEVWINLPIKEKSHLQLLATTVMGRVSLRARFEIDPVDDANVLVDGRTPPTENFFLARWVISEQVFTSNFLSASTSNLDYFLQLNARLRLVWDLEKIVSMMEGNQLGSPEYVEGIRSRWNHEKLEAERLCELVWSTYRAARWVD